MPATEGGDGTGGMDSCSGSDATSGRRGNSDRRIAGGQTISWQRKAWQDLGELLQLVCMHKGATRRPCKRRGLVKYQVTQGDICSGAKEYEHCAENIGVGYGPGEHCKENPIEEADAGEVKTSTEVRGPAHGETGQ